MDTIMKYDNKDFFIEDDENHQNDIDDEEYGFDEDEFDKKIEADEDPILEENNDIDDLEDDLDW